MESRAIRGCAAARSVVIVGVALVSVPAARASDWIVDAGGSGDFAELSKALSDPAVVDGDRLWVLPGSYGAFETSKDVELLAATPAGFQAAGARFVGNSSIAVRGMRTFDLEFDGVRGLALISGCEVGLALGAPLAEPLYRGATRIEDSNQVLFVHSTLRGSGDCYPDYHAGGVRPALSVLRSTVALHQCELWGGNDTIDSPECNPHYGGEVGIDARESSVVYLVASPVRGGGSPWPGTAAALHVDDSFVEVRGQGRDVLWAGHPATPPVTGSGTVLVSGVRVGPLPLPAWVGELPTPRPYLVAAPTANVGAALAIELHGPLGAPFLLALGFGPTAGALPLTTLGPVWLDLFGPLVYGTGATAGHTLAQSAAIAIPPLPGLSGLTLVLQAYFPTCVACDPLLVESLTPPAAAQIR